MVAFFYSQREYIKIYYLRLLINYRSVIIIVIIFFYLYNLYTNILCSVLQLQYSQQTTIKKQYYHF